jgi:hypothetical protein
MALVIHFKDGTTSTNSNWASCQEVGTDGNFFNVLGGGGAVEWAFVPTANVLYVDLNA